MCAMIGDRTETHPSFGMISVTRVQGNPGHLFGSSLDTHYTSFRLRIHQGKRYITDVGESRYGADLKNPIVEVQLSATQFTELITNMNVGDGVPCTISRVGGQRVEEPPYQTLDRNQIKRDFEARIQSIFGKLEAMEQATSALLEKKSFTKADKSDLSGRISNIRMEVEKNLPFILEIFNEATENTISAAKIEVDTFVTNILVAAGAGSMKQNLLGNEKHERLEKGTDPKE